MTEEALKLALEALETLMIERGSIYDKAITAIKEALANEALEKIAENARELGLDYEPEQESVTWRNAAIRVGEDLCSVGPFRYYDMTAEQWLDWALSVVTVHAPPPQLTWVNATTWRGLTEDEILSISADCASSHQHMDIHFARAIEAKLKEKNT